MGKVLKAEIRYHFNTIGSAAIIYLILVILILSLGWESAEKDGKGLLSVALALTFLVGILRLLTITKEKKDRFLMQLPISNYYLGFCRLLVGIFLWIVLLSIFYLGLFIIRINGFKLWLIYHTLFLSGLWLIINAFPMMHRDLNYYFDNPYQKIILGTIYVVIFTIGLLLFTSSALVRYFPALPLDLFLTTQSLITNDPELFSALKYLLGGVIFSLLGVYAFKIRKAYVE